MIKERDAYICKYEGFEIKFDSSEGKFFASSKISDSEFRQTSFAGLKKNIRNFNKENSSFGKFKIQNNPNTSHGRLDGVVKLQEVIGVLRGERLSVLKDGQLSTLSKYDLDGKMIYLESNIPTLNKAISLENEAAEISKKYRSEILEVLKDLKVVTLRDFILQEGINLNEKSW